MPVPENVKEEMHCPRFSPIRIYEAYLDCRRRKRGTANALSFEMNLAENLFGLEEDLNSGTYTPSRSVCFISLKPKPREIFAAHFRDRVVHHLFVREIERYWEKIFIHDSFACRKNKGTHAAVDRLAYFVRKVTRGGRRRAWFLQIDVHNFFMSIDRRILFKMIDQGLRRQFDVPNDKLPLFCSGYDRYLTMRELAKTLVFNDPSENYIRKSPKDKWRNIDDHKSLFHCPEHKGLPIGNLTSQFFGNVYLNPLDQFIKHELKARCYVRYVDDAVILHEDKKILEEFLFDIERFLDKKLLLRINKKALRLKPVSCGINFLGYIVHPAYKLVRRRVVGNFKSRLKHFEKLLVIHDEEQQYVHYRYDHDGLDNLLAVINSYLAHLKRASSLSLLMAIIEENPWLRNYFDIEDFKARRTWKPPRNFPRLSIQYGWFRWRFPDSIIFFRIGWYYELFGDDAMWAHQDAGLVLLKPRFDGLPRAGAPVSLVGRYMNKAIDAGFKFLKVAETGYKLFRIKERFPQEYFEPTIIPRPFR